MFICFEFKCANYIFLFFNLKCNTLVQVNKPRGIAFQTFNTYFPALPHPFQYQNLLSTVTHVYFCHWKIYKFSFEILQKIKVFF